MIYFTADLHLNHENANFTYQQTFCIERGNE